MASKSVPGRYPQSQLDALRAGLTTIAVTGTNGKTTTTGMLAAIAEAAGQVPVRVTTLGMWVGEEQIAGDGSMASFVRTLERARELGAKTLALEVTSRALAGGFATRWPAEIAVFTNLSQDHLDRHGSPERYLAAKAQLFAGPRPPASAVLNASDPASRLIAEVMPQPVARHGFCPTGATSDDALPTSLAASQVELQDEGTRIRLAPSPLADALGGTLSLSILGDFNADNALAAALAARVAGFTPEAIVGGLSAFAGVPGRFERVATAPLSVIDFAHSPAALQRVLATARQLARKRRGRVACVFGCGGERDAGKRPQMGDLADRLADAVWLTTDNPRSEDPAAIAAMVQRGAAARATWHDVPDRATAIAAAANWARPEDVLVVAGRGPEAFQQLAEGPVPLCDRRVLRAALAARGVDPSG